MPAAAQPSVEPPQGNGSNWKDREPPPTFDGRNPDKAFPRWLKELELWKFETEIPKEKWGVKVFRQLQGSAKAVADSMSFEELACEKGLDNLMKILKEHYDPHLQVSLPKAFEEAIYGEIRASRESFSDYVIRCEHNFKELERQGVKLHELVVGYVMFRHANLTDVQEAQMLTWGSGKYDRKTVIENLRKLDKGVFDVKRKNTAYLLDVDEVENEGEPNDATEVYAQNDEVTDSDGDEDYVYIGEDDLKEVYDEEHIMEALATYQDVRRSLREQKTNRGFYPSGKGSSSAKGGKGRGKGFGKSKPVLDFKGRSREPMKFGKQGTKVHIDLLKLRTKCARCGAIGHWARECKNAPDERGRASLSNKSPSASVSSPSTRSGFFVETSGDHRANVLFAENESVSFMSYLPTFGRVLSSVLNKGKAEQDLRPEPPESFVGVTTRAGEGVVDTAAQDGLVGKAALLELTSMLRDYGLQIRWNHKKQAQASGIGGKAKVIGIAEIPVGIAGVNGLLEATVVQENVPLLLPIRMLKQLRAVVDLDGDKLQLKAYGVETSMHPMPSGHMAVSVTEFAPEGWSLPKAAESEHLKHEQFVIENSGFLQSMYPLESKPACRVQFEVGVKDGSVAVTSDDGPEKPGRTDSSRSDVSRSSPESSCHSTLASPRGQDGRPHGSGRHAGKGVRLATRWLALQGYHLNDGRISFYDKGNGQTVGVCQDYQGLLVPWHSEDQGSAHQGPGELRSSYYGAEGQWESVLQGGVVQCVQEQMGVPCPRPVGGEDQGDREGQDELLEQTVEDYGSDGARPELFDATGPVRVQPGCSQMGGEEIRADPRTPFLPLQEPSVRVLQVGRDGTKVHEGQAGQYNGRDDGGRVPRESGQGQPGGHQGADAVADGDSGCGSPGGSESVESAAGVDAVLPEPVPRDASAATHGWLSIGQRALSSEGLPEDAGPGMCCMMQHDAQLVHARKLQMQAFCPQASIPWNMPMRRDYFVYDENDQKWSRCEGWLPKKANGRVYLTVFDDADSMKLWSEDAGKTKALSAGERKKAILDIDHQNQVLCPAEHSYVIEAVSPNRIHSFVEYDQAMAILDPLGQEQFWSKLKARKPDFLILQPDRQEGSLRLALDAAEWQATQGGAYVVLCDEQDESYVCQELEQEGQVSGSALRGRQCGMSNSERLLRQVQQLCHSEKKWSHENTNDLLQNPKVHHENTNDLVQNPKVHHAEDAKEQDSVYVFHENTDDLQQNPEVHRSFILDVCQEHDWVHKTDVCQEHDWSHDVRDEQESFLTMSQVNMIEFRAGRLLRDKDFSFMSVEKLCASLPLRSSSSRQSVMEGHYLSLGLYAHGNHYGVTKLAKELPRFTEYINQVIKYQCKCCGLENPTWTTVAIGLNAGSLPHKDNHNRHNTKNYIFSVGRHKGGGLWTEMASTTTSKTTWLEVAEGKTVAGQVHDIHYKVKDFDPKKWHASMPWDGLRTVISAFTSRGVDCASEKDLVKLREMGFVPPQDNNIYMFDGTIIPGVGQHSRVYVEEDEQRFEPVAEDQEPEDSPIQESGEGDVDPTAEEKRLVKKLHENMGHPRPLDMARSLRLAHAKPHIIKYVAKKFSCATCEAKPRPKPARPAILPKSYEPGKVVGVDVVFLPGLDPRQSFPALSMVDWGTNYQMVERLRSTEADHTWRTFMRTWARVFGVPDIIVADLGSEFRGQFSELAGQAGALIRHTAARSPWQAGKTERSGSHFKHIYERARESSHISSWEEIKTLLYEVESAKNRYGNRSGFSPMQRQIGHNLRLPGSLLSDDHLDPQLVVQSAGDEMRRTLEIRKCAQEAYIKSQTEVALSKAKNARTRVGVDFHPGETVYVYRQPRERKRRHMMTPEAHEGRKPTWVGPGLILAVEKPSVWVSMKGELWKVSFEQCRHATSEEQIAKELLAGELEALREELGRSATKRTFRDMTGEGAPEEGMDGQEQPLRDLSDGPSSMERPAQRPRLREASEVPIPEDDDELDYAPSEPDEPQAETPQVPQAQDEPQVLPQPAQRRRTESEPEPTPTPRISEDTVQAVLWNERLDGHFPGSPTYEAVRRLSQYKPKNQPYFTTTREQDVHGWVCFEEGRWKSEQDDWEFVNPDVIIRRHRLPRNHLCNPSKIEGALMPRRLKVRQTFMVMEDGSMDTCKDFWFKQRKQSGKTNTAWTGFTVFSRKEVNLKDFMVAKARGQGEVFEHEIKPEEWPEWRKTDKGEWDKIVDTGAIKVLSLEESRRIRNSEERSRIIPSRMVRRWKPSEQPGQPATRKSRWCLRGDRDPDLLELDRHAPTLNTTSFGVLLQIAASMKYAASVGDLRNAFCQSGPLIRRQGKLYASLPRGGIEGLHEEQLVEVVAGVYGLGDSPQHWRKTLKQAIMQLGYRESLLDPAVYYLQTGEILDGVIAVEVDDLFTFGNAVHEERMSKLREKFQFGKYEEVMKSAEGVGFNGRRIRQLPNYEFEVDMFKFVQERLSPVQLSKGRKACAKSLANDSEVNQMRAVVGALNWLAKEGRPDAAAAASVGASTFPKPTVQDVIDINRAVTSLKERPELKIRIRNIKPQDLSWGVVSDASFANAYAGHSQGAYAILAFDDKLKDGYRVPCSLISWRSGRIQKVVNSTLAAETQSLSKGLGELCWVVSLYNELMDSKFRLPEWEQRLQGNRVITMASEDASDDLKSSPCIVDAKALFDHLSRETAGPSADKRTGLEIQVIRQSMSAINSAVRWVPHPHMVVDGLTKKNANMTALYDLLDSGQYQIVDQAIALEEKRLERDTRGYNRR